MPQIAGMKRRSNDAENCEGWLSTRNKKKVCPSVSSKHPIAYKHATYSFVSTSKLTQHMAPLNQHQTSILKFVQKDEQNFGAVKNPDQKKEILSDIQKTNPDCGHMSTKNLANTKMNADEYKQVVNCQQPTNSCRYTDAYSSRLEGDFEKLKEKEDFDSYKKKCSKENCISKENSISVETLKTMNVENVSLDLIQNSILLDTTNLPVPKTSSADEVKDFKGKNNHILNRFESSENALPRNPPPKITSTPTNDIKLANQNLPIVTGMKTSVDYNSILKDTLVDCRKQTNISKDEEIGIPDSDKSAKKKMLTDKQQTLRTADEKMLPKSKFDRKADNYELKECVFDSNPQEGNASYRTFGENDLFEEKSVGDSLTDFSEFPPTFQIYSKSSKEILQKKVFNNSETNQSADFSPISNTCKRQDSNHIQSSNCDERQWTHHANSIENKSTLNECDFETASTFDDNTCQFDEYFESSECQQDNSDEDLTLELGNPDFTLRTQRSVNESLDFIPETEDFTFNSDSI